MAMPLSLKKSLIYLLMLAQSTLYSFIAASNETYQNLPGTVILDLVIFLASSKPSFPAAIDSQSAKQGA